MAASTTGSGPSGDILPGNTNNATVSTTDNASTTSLAKLVATNNERRYHQKPVNHNLYANLVFTKFKKGQPIRSQCQNFVINSYVKYRELYPDWTVGKLVQFTSEICGIGERSIYKILQKKKQNELLKTPGKHRDMSSRRRTVKYDAFVQHAIRRKVHEFFTRNEVPTLKKVLIVVEEDESLPKIGLESLRLLLREIGFRFVKSKRNCAIIERDDIVAWRRHYLREIRQHRHNGKTIYYTDETWVNAGEHLDREWVDTTVLSAKDAFLRGLTTGKKKPTSKGGRLIVGHCGSEDGFVEGGLLVFNAKKTKTDYHSEMNHSNFMRWFENVLPELKKDSILVIDNAPYHSTKLDIIPTTSWRKPDIQEWCIKNNAYFTDDYLKSELLKVVAAMKPETIRYKFDTRCSEFGITVLRLPPYHCNFNPIELVWSQVKRYVRSNNKTYKMDEVERLLREGIDNVTPDQWRNYISHIIKEENKYWELDGLVETTVDQLIIQGDDDSSESNFSNSDDE